MPRSNWKGPFLANSLLRNFKVFKKKAKKKKSLKLKTWSRRSTILPVFVGYTFSVHNGKQFVRITVNDEMIGHKLGEFVPTRSRYNYKKGKK